MKEVFKILFKTSTPVLYLILIVLIVQTGVAIKEKGLDFGSRISTVSQDSSGMSTVIPSGGVMANATGLAVATSTAGTLSTSTLYFVTTTVDDGGGETVASNRVSCSVGEGLTGAPLACVVTMTVNPLASTTRLWYGTVSGVYIGYVTATSSVLVATTTGFTTATIPTSNGAYKDVPIARYHATAPTLTDGQLKALLLDIIGNLKVTMATVLDYVNDSITVYMHGNSYNYIASPAANTVVKSTSGVITDICVGTASSTATDIIEISDHASDGDGNVKLKFTDLEPGCFPVNLRFATGITVDTTIQADVTIGYY